MRSIEFHNREEEIKEIRNILNTEPTLITFIYGPINSGKTELMNQLIKQLPEEYVVFYINLRTKLLASYNEFVESLFELEIRETRRKETLKELVSSITKVAGIPITREFLDYVFKDKKPKNAFSYIIKLFEVVKEGGQQPVLILDELQKIGDVKVDGLLIYELFNFFIDLTKEKHLAHVFVATSDSLFLESIYTEAMLQERCRYLLVGDFDNQTTLKFLDNYKFSDMEKEVAWNYCGGKPVCLVELVNSENREERARGMFMFRTGEIETRLKLVKELGDEIMIGGRRCDVHYEKLVNVLNMFVNRDEIEMNEVDEVSKRYLVKYNILFVDSLTKMMKPQSKLNLRAIREVMKEK
jgi:AAA+ ATPase superfamily predicted ATPase